MEGVSGLYRGLGMKLISHSVGTVVYNHAKKVRSKLSFKIQFHMLVHIEIFFL